MDIAKGHGEFVPEVKFIHRRALVRIRQQQYHMPPQSATRLLRLCFSFGLLPEFAFATG
jgi:hypothetical protein